MFHVVEIHMTSNEVFGCCSFHTYFLNILARYLCVTIFVSVSIKKRSDVSMTFWESLKNELNEFQSKN